MISASSCAKVILIGEHSAVDGYATVAYPVKSLKLTAFISNHKQEDSQISTFKKMFDDKFQTNSNRCTIKIDSNIPLKSGLGSSTAFVNAIIKALLTFHEIKVTQNELYSLVTDFESSVNSRVSGIDQATIVFEQPVLLENKKVTMLQETDLKVEDCLIIQSGPATESTTEMVQKVSNHSSKKEIFQSIHTLSHKYLSKKIRLEEMFFEANRLLQRLEIVGDMAKKIIEDIESIGGVAKVSGAGGFISGSGIILGYHEDRNALLELCNAKNYQVLN